jgi:hypothetical protein
MSEPTLQPIKTYYHNTLFRSRLEARWAVFWDALAVTWAYELEGYELPTGSYLPDFWLPQYECFVEIKARTPTDRAKRLAGELARSSEHHVVMVVGMPKSPDPLCDPETCHDEPDTKDLPYHLVGFVGDFRRESWPSDSTWRFETEARMESLYEHLRENYSEHPDWFSAEPQPFEYTTASAWQLIERDREFFKGRYTGKPFGDRVYTEHPFWVWGPVIGLARGSAFVWDWGERLEIRRAGFLHSQSSPIVNHAYEEAMSYRFWE